METKDLKWENYGYMNGWSETPERVKQAWADPDNDIKESNVGRCLTEYRSEKYQFVYLVDSSD